MDYASNSKKQKEERPEVAKLVQNTVTPKKKTLGVKFKDVFLGADAKGLASYLVIDIIIPSFRDVVYDVFTRGTGRVLYGDDISRGRGPLNRGGGRPPTNYQTPVNRSFVGVQTLPVSSRGYPAPRGEIQGPQENFLITSREDAEVVMDAMGEMVISYGSITLYEMKSMLGLPASHVDYKWGWYTLAGAKIKQERDGWLLMLPNPSPIK